MSSPSFKTTASPKSVTFTMVSAGSPSLKLQRRTLRQERSACTIRFNSRKLIARESWAEACSLCKAVMPGTNSASVSAAFMEPRRARSWTTSIVRPSSMVPKISGTKGLLDGLLASIARICSSRFSPFFTYCSTTTSRDSFDEPRLSVPRTTRLKRPFPISSPMTRSEGASEAMEPLCHSVAAPRGTGLPTGCPADGAPQRMASEISG
mmetsp:Transcript_52291/g.144841  ORF Transcript_52291/g.144841 Transcript_52291/m.144841 type:complete len:208 (-) Transcript_52291:34-657(-)